MSISVLLFALLFNYIIPIWNWSDNVINVYVCSDEITLFLYGIGAISRKSNRINH